MRKPYHLTREWTDFDPKEELITDMHEIKMADGVIHLMCWPYDGKWLCLSKDQTKDLLIIQIDSNTKSVRKADQTGWGPK